MLYFVRVINIEKNPRAGQTVAIIPGNTRLTFKVTVDAPAFGWLQNEKDIIVHQWRTFGPEKFQVEGTVAKEEKWKEIEGKISSGEFGIEQDIQKYNLLMPEPEWLYEHEDIEIDCSNCGKKSLVSGLESDYMWVGDDFGEVYSDRICPHCKTWDCCEIEYENAEATLARLKPPKQ